MLDKSCFGFLPNAHGEVVAVAADGCTSGAVAAGLFHAYRRPDIQDGVRIAGARARFRSGDVLARREHGGDSVKLRRIPNKGFKFCGLRCRICRWRAGQANSMAFRDSPKSDPNETFTGVERMKTSNLDRSWNKRRFLGNAGIASAALATRPSWAQSMVRLGLPGGPDERPIVTDFPHKGAMILQRSRPPLLETPFESLRQRRLHAERSVLRAMALGGHSDRGGCRQISARGAWACQPDLVIVADGNSGSSASGDRRRQPVFRKLARVFSTSGSGRRMGQRRNGECSLDRSEDERRAGSRRGEGRRCASAVQGPR